MSDIIQQEPKQEHKKGQAPKYRNALDRISRRERRNPLKQKYRNDRKPVGEGFIQVGIAWNGQAMFFPKRKKMKGWQRTKAKRSQPSQRYQYK